MLEGGSTKQERTDIFNGFIIALTQLRKGLIKLEKGQIKTGKQQNSPQCRDNTEQSSYMDSGSQEARETRKRDMFAEIMPGKKPKTIPDVILQTCLREYQDEIPNRRK